eukprot:355061-Chlamydomonas_euryale.AAC.5
MAHSSTCRMAVQRAWRQMSHDHTWRQGACHMAVHGAWRQMSHDHTWRQGACRMAVHSTISTMHGIMWDAAHVRCGAPCLTPCCAAYTCPHQTPGSTPAAAYRSARTHAPAAPDSGNAAAGTGAGDLPLLLILFRAQSAIPAIPGGPAAGAGRAGRVRLRGASSAPCLTDARAAGGSRDCLTLLAPACSTADVAAARLPLARTLFCSACRSMWICRHRCTVPVVFAVGARKARDWKATHVTRGLGVAGHCGDAEKAQMWRRRDAEA